MAIYLGVSFGALLISLFLLWSYVNIHVLSLAPLVLIFVSLLQISVFRSYAKPDTELWTTDNTMYSSREVDQEAYRIGMKYHSLCKLSILPLLCALIFYGSGILKILLAVAVYLLSFLPVKFFVRWEKKREKEQ
jgi:hypothetical protein